MAKRIKIDSRGPKKGKSLVILEHISRGMSWIALSFLRSFQCSDIGKNIWIFPEVIRIAGDKKD
jgi:hypothetical protein